jgi:tetratricopeptide (TPR) repeat protein
VNSASLEPDPLDQLADAFLERLRRGERPELTEYTRQFPDLAERIRKLFPALMVLEEFGSVDGPPAGSEVARAALKGHIPARLGEYRILREVGRGGMGIVYEAVQESLGRHVALKVLPFHSLLGPDRVERFRREARAAARLHHTNIVPVFGVGEQDGIHYYAMQFISGQGLDDVLQEVRRLRRSERANPSRLNYLAASVAEGLLSGQFPDSSTSHESDGNKDGCNKKGVESKKKESEPGTISSTMDPKSPDPSLFSYSSLSSQPEAQYYRSVAEIGTQVADALAYAHREGVLHRDIKPSNLLLDTSGRVWVSDFGLAKAEDSDDLTQTGDMVGTLCYMAPERLQGQADPRSDVYGLGVTLYEMMTLQPAFTESNRGRLMERIAQQEPISPRKLDGRIPRDLETIVLKAMAKEAALRYSSAEALAQDLRRVLADRPIQARRASPVERTWRWCRRNPLVASLVGLVAVLVLAVAGSIGWAARDRAARDIALDEQVGRDLDEATARIENGKWPEALTAVDQAEKLLTAANHRKFPPRLLELQKDLTLAQHLEDIYAQPKTEEFYLGNEPDKAYTEAFAKAGIDVAVLSVAEAVERMHGRSIRRELARALDFWSYMRQRTGNQRAPDWKELVEIAEAIDPDPERNSIRQARRRRDPKALEMLASSADFVRLSPETVLLLAVALYDSGGKEQATGLLRQAQRQYPEDWWISATLGWWCLTAHPPQYEEAIRFITASIAVRPRNPYSLHALGNALMGKLAYEEAVGTFSRAIQLKPDYWDAWWRREDAYLKLGQRERALRDYSSLISQNPKEFMGWFSRGSTYNKLFQYDKALDDFTEAIKLEPNNVLALVSRGWTYNELHHYDKAIDDFNKAVKLNPKDVVALHDRGWTYNELHQHDKALDDYSKAIELDAKDVWARTNRGSTYFELHQNEKAFADLNEAVKLDPKNAWALTNRGWTYNKVQQYDKALDDLNKAIELDPVGSWAWINRGWAHRGLGRWDKALADYREAIRIKPSLAAEANQLAWQLATDRDPKQRDGRQAEAFAQLAVQAAPTDANYQRTLGAAHYRARNWKETVAALEKSMELRKGGDGFDWFFLAMAHWQQDHKGEAHKWYDQAVQWLAKNKQTNHRNDDELHRFQAEAADLLGVKDMKD